MSNDEIIALDRLYVAVRVLRYTLQIPPAKKDPRTDQKAYTEVFTALSEIDKDREGQLFDDEAAFKELMSKP